jgi:hypothetical protein
VPRPQATAAVVGQPNEKEALMASESKGTPVEIEVVSQEEAHKHLRETYVDSDGAIKFFSAYVAEKEKALKAFDAAVNRGGELATAFAQNPIGTLQERGLIGPLDLVDIEGLHLPHSPLPWPFPHCRWVCKLECKWEVHWVCIRIFGFRFCWPRLHLHCRWVCRLVCF